MDTSTATPLMKQYHQVKQQFSDALVLFQVGDFYELFFDDAKKAAAFLGIALTKRGKNNGEPIPLCGVPVHALNHYLNKLIRGGFKVALCDQLEEAKPGKVVDRGVTRVFTPGTLTDSSLLDEKNASYLFSFFPLQHSWGLLFGELLTAQLYATVLPPAGDKLLESELIRFFPDEILLPASSGKHYQTYFKQLGYFTSLVEDDQNNDAVDSWISQFRHDARQTLASYDSVRAALTMMYSYLRKTHEGSLAQFNHVQLYKPEDFLVLDHATQRNLELIKNNQDGGRAHTLFATLDGAKTAMGSRLIKKWILRPLVKQEAIVQRQDVVADLMNDISGRQQLEKLLAQLGDIERVIGRIALRRAQLADYVMLAQALCVIPEIKCLLEHKKHLSLMRILLEQCIDFSGLCDLLERSLNDDPTKEWLIKMGFNEQLDQMRDLIESGNRKIVELEEQEQKSTGIGSLKIRYNNIHGYSIEVTKTHYDAIPAHYIRRQTLVGRERFTTEQLQQLEHEIAQAKTDIAAVEQAIFEEIKQNVALYIAALRKTAQALAQFDALLGFAVTAYDYNYTRSTISANRDIVVKQGRHPVIERSLTNKFIGNDIELTDDEAVWIITGPNMGGKSTFLRQVALIAIMAQCGSFVPAAQAQLPILDRIFTRIGAGDNLVGGKSTFMVEMEETATICTQATKNSLVILDEVGRGTSTFDGLAIAQAVVEYIATHIQARCLFATHYQELTLLEQVIPGIVNYHATSTKTHQGTILFLYKMVKGIADGSFGVEVARLAALPAPIIARAEHLVHTLKKDQQLAVFPAMQASDTQFLATIAMLENRVKKQENALNLLENIDYDNLSPKQAFDLLWHIKGSF